MSGAWASQGEPGKASQGAAPGVPPAFIDPVSSRVDLARILPGMVARGHGLDTLCLYLSIARTALLDLVVALGLPTPHDRAHRRAGGRNPWQPHDIPTFIALWMEGWQAASLAERFGRSRSSVWSKARQLGLPRRDRKALFRPEDPLAAAACGPQASPGRPDAPRGEPKEKSSVAVRALDLAGEFDTAALAPSPRSGLPRIGAVAAPGRQIPLTGVFSGSALLHPPRPRVRTPDALSPFAARCRGSGLAAGDALDPPRRALARAACGRDPG